MIDRLLDVTTAFSLLLMLMVLVSVRRAHIRVEYSVSWLVAAAFLVVLSRWRALLEWTARQLGVSDPAVAWIMIVSAVFLVVFYRHSRVISHLKDNNIALAQRVAILEFRINALDEAQEAQPGR